MKVSVIIPAYNRAKLLIGALNSLSLQDYPKKSFEIIVVDNNSKDDTKERVREFIKKNIDKINMKYVFEERQGLVYSRHTGAANADGEIVFFGDDDGIYDMNWISKILEVYQKYPNIGAVGSKIMIKWDIAPPKWIGKYEWVLGKLSYGEGIMIKEKGLYINGGSFSIKKDILFQLGGFNIGQSGQFLLGDCESGLCRKLHAKNIPIGFTDETTMWHIQFVDIQGRVSDLERRFINNGISDAYNDLFVKMDHNNYMLTQIKLKKALVKRIILKFKPFRKSIKIENQLLISKYKAYLQYYVKYTTDIKLIDLLNKKDWVLSNNYEYPYPTIISKVK